MSPTAFAVGALISCFALAPGAIRTVAQAPSSPQQSDHTPAAGTKGYSTPRCSYCPAPQYSKEGLKRRIEGDVTLKAVIGTDGRAHNIVVTRGLGYGLDEKAVEVVRDKWTFIRAKGPDGKPAAVHLIIQVDFHLY